MMAQVSVIVTLLGVCVVYLITAHDLLQGTVLQLPSSSRLASVLLLTAPLLPLGCAKDVGFLSIASATGQY
jgi:amino acid permease